MTARETLGLAALAAGLKVVSICDESARIESDGCKSGYSWSPYNDDGDAFRLAVAIGWESCQDYINGALMAARIDGSDEAKAIRGAITFAAAEVGRSIQARLTKGA